jgi:hypothetical protein
MNLKRVGIAALPVLAAVALQPLAASAQTPTYAAHGETIHGTIAAVDNVNHLFVADDRGFTDDVTLRSGASIFSSGARLEPGVRVTIVGAAAGPTFLASRIATEGRPGYWSAQREDVADAPYPIVEPEYYPAAAYYPAPYYPGYYGYGYGYGSAFSIGIGFGFHGGYGGYRGFGGYGYGGGYHGFVGGGIGVHFHGR